MIDTKTNITQTILDALTSGGNKISFMPDAAVVDAIRYVEENGIPSNKHEDYKYCNLEAVFRKEFKTISNKFNSITKIDSHKLKDCVNVVVVNGEYSESLSDKSSEVKINTLSNSATEIKNYITKYADVNNDALIALNTAFCSGGLFISISGVVTKPIHIINITSAKENAVINPRQLIVLEKSAEATIIETFVSENNSAKVFQNHLSEVILNENSKLKSYRLQNEDENAYQMNTVQVSVNRYANYTTNTFTFNGALVRNNLNVVLASDLCEAHLNGLFISSGTKLIDNHTLVDHQKPNCESNELYKGIAKDKSTGVFNGKIYVRKDAQKTNAYQSSKNILLSEDATINTKPQLEIYADDVKCSHGTSTGKVDEAALFYLKSRGIGDEKARKLLLQAFAQEVIDKIEIEELKERVVDLFEKAL
ncbi:MAG: Fe-S cluster assembly protein SufD [Bacteroidia bacterium]|nr:Fe-S cluster assembly protein SufD [Bacteroidia bacterium]